MNTVSGQARSARSRFSVVPPYHAWVYASFPVSRSASHGGSRWSTTGQPSAPAVRKSSMQRGSSMSIRNFHSAQTLTPCILTAFSNQTVALPNRGSGQ